MSFKLIHVSSTVQNSRTVSLSCHHAVCREPCEEVGHSSNHQGWVDGTMKLYSFAAF